MQKTAIIIGGGIGGLALSAMLAKSGYSAKILEKNSSTGGRARHFKEKGFTFDMGPSWYMMPDVFEHFFNIMGENISDYYTLERLSPSYKIFLNSNDTSQLFYSDLNKNKEIFEKIEPGSGKVLEKFLIDTKEQYEIAYKEFMFKNYDSLFDFINLRVAKVGAKLPIFSNQKKIVNKLFKSEMLQKVMQYQTVLLGTSPANTPGIYSLMNYVDLVLGEWYPSGGIRKVPESLEKIAIKNGVEIITNSEIQKINIENDIAKSVTLINGETLSADIIISNADIANTDINLLDEKYKQKSLKYWDSRTLAPSAFIMYLGLNEKLENVEHHNLIFSKNWDENFSQIFDEKVWPTDPSMYICVPSKTDKDIAPENMENLFVLVPISAGLDYDEKFIENYENSIFTKLEETFKVKNLKEKVIYKKTYCVKDFVKDYNAFKGTALGLAHTLKQTAFFRPNNVHPKVKNLFYVGAGTNPGIGMPICLISAELCYKRIMKIKDQFPLEKI